VNLSQLYFIGKGSSGDALDYFTAEDAVYPAGSAAYATGLNNHPLVDYPEAEDGFVDLQGVVYPSGIVSVHLFWAATTNAGGVNWSISWERDDPSTFFVPGVNLNVDSFDAAKTAVDMAPLILGRLQETVIIFTPAEMDGVVPGDPYRLRVRRIAGVLPDTMLGDALLFRVSLETP